VSSIVKRQKNDKKVTLFRKNKKQKQIKNYLTDQKNIVSNLLIFKTIWKSVRKYILVSS
jgi:hypothetical protein